MLKPTMRRTALALGLSFVVYAMDAGATPSGEACLSSYEQTQRLRKAGKLIEAQEQALVCMSESCPASLRAECITWLDEIRRLVPSVVISAKGEDGCGLADARVFVDGSPRANSIDGRPIALNPGEHLFRVEVSGARPIEQRVVLAQGDHDHRVDLGSAPTGASCSPKAAPSPEGPTKASISPLTYAVAGVGLATLVVGAGFEISGLSQESTLSECKPRCSSPAVDEMQRTFLVGDVLVASGVAVLGVAAYLWWSGRTAEPKRARWIGPPFVGAMTF